MLGAALFLSHAASAQQQYPYGPPIQQPGAAPLQQPAYGQPSTGYPQAPYGTTQLPYAQPQPQPQGPYMQPQAPYTASTQSDDDSGRGLEFFYARAGAGGAFVAPGALGHASNLGLEKTAGFGGSFEAALGIRLLVLTVGPRARLLLTSPMTLWQLGAEAAFRVPLGRWDPFVGINGGYTFGNSPLDNGRCSNGLPASACGATDHFSIGGADVGVAAGTDYYFTPAFSVGGALNIGFLFLSRKTADGASDPQLQSSASMTGLATTLGLHLALHL